MEFVCILVITLYLKKVRKGKPLAYLPILAAASIVQVVIAHYDILRNHTLPFGEFIKNHSIYLYLIFESTCCLLFLRSAISSSLLKKIILVCNIVFVIYALCYWALNYAMWRTLPFIQNIEGFLIIIFCIFYFYELFTLTPHKSLLTKPDFWAISGMLALFSTITPLFLFLSYLTKNSKLIADQLFLINNFAYILFFLTFLLAIVVDAKGKSIELEKEL